MTGVQTCALPIYKITSALSDVLLNGDLKPQKPIDALVYPSVAFREGMNFAILPEPYKSKMKLVQAETKIIEITNVLGYGIFVCQLLASLKSVSSDGRLKWEASDKQGSGNRLLV